MRGVIVCLLLAHALTAFGVEYPTSTFLLRKSDFPQLRRLVSKQGDPAEYTYFAEDGITSKKDAGGQPYRLTDFDSSHSIYLRIRITPKNEAEHKQYVSIEEKGLGIRIDSLQIVREYNERLGGYEIKERYDKLKDYPTDYYSVTVSTK